MTDDDPHRSLVRSWLAAEAQARSPEQVIALFEAGFHAMWSRAFVTLGEVTLGAIVDRVLLVVGDRHPLLSALRVESNGVRFERLLAEAGALVPEQVRAAAEEVLTEFLTVLGNLTAEILTPALHAALSTAAPASRAAEASPEDEDVPS